MVGTLLLGLISLVSCQLRAQISIIYPADDQVIGTTTPTITGDAAAGSLVAVAVDGKLQKLTCANNNPAISTLTNPLGQWAVTVYPPLADNSSHTISAREMIGCATTSTASSSFFVDTSIGTPTPAPTITSPPSGETFITQSVPFSGTAGAPGYIINLYINDVPNAGATAGDLGAWNLQTSTLINGGYTGYATAIGTALGSEVSGPSNSVFFTVDYTTVAAITMPNEAGYEYVQTPVFEGMADAGASVVITVTGASYQQLEATADDTGFWTATSSGLDNGNYTVTVDALLLGANPVTVGPVPFTVNINAIITTPKKIYWLNDVPAGDYSADGLVRLFTANPADLIFMAFMAINEPRACYAVDPCGTGFNCHLLDMTNATPPVCNTDEAAVGLIGTAINFGNITDDASLVALRNEGKLGNALVGMGLGGATTSINNFLRTKSDEPDYAEYLTELIGNIVAFVIEQDYDCFCFDLEDNAGAAVADYEPAAAFTRDLSHALKTEYYSAKGKNISISIAPGTFGIANCFSLDIHRALINEKIDIATGEINPPYSGPTVVDTIDYSIIQTIDFNIGCQMECSGGTCANFNCSRWCSCTKISPSNVPSIVSMSPNIIDLEDPTNTNSYAVVNRDGYTFVNFMTSNSLMVNTEYDPYAEPVCRLAQCPNTPLSKVCVHLPAYSALLIDGDCSGLTGSHPGPCPGALVGWDTLSDSEQLALEGIEPDQYALDVYQGDPSTIGSGPWTTPKSYLAKQQFFFEGNNFNGKNIGGGMSMWEVGDDPAGDLLNSIDFNTAI